MAASKGADPPQISVIVPALDEEQAIGATLEALRAQRCTFEIIVVDGGSIDATADIALRSGADRVVRAPRGRALQMNAGAALARGRWLVFVHADTLLPPEALADILALTDDDDVLAGGFRHRFSGGGAAIAAVSWLTNLRCRLTGIIYGDQAFFIRRETFADIGGFPVQAPLEDVAICRRLKQMQQRPQLLRSRVITDARKFRQRGVLRCMAEVIVILACDRLGLPMPRLGFFRPVR